MELIDNISRLLGDHPKQTIHPGARLKIAALCFLMYAFEALKAELKKINKLNFIFTSPTFVPNEVTDKIRKERKELHIPKLDRERGLYGSEFEIQLRNKLIRRAVAKEFADWIRRKATFRSNSTKAPMQQIACVQVAGGTDTVYMPLHGFTAIDFGYQQGYAVSNLVNKMDEAPFAATYLSLFDQIWNDPEKQKDVTQQICEHIASVYQDTLIWNKLFNYQKDDAKRQHLKTQLLGKVDNPINPGNRKVLISDYFASDWLPMDSERIAMPVAPHLGGLYEQLLHRLTPLSARPQETLAKLVPRVKQVQTKQHEIDKAAARLAKEKQFNRKVEINAQLRQLKNELEKLTGREST